MLPSVSDKQTAHYDPMTVIIKVFNTSQCANAVSVITDSVLNNKQEVETKGREESDGERRNRGRDEDGETVGGGTGGGRRIHGIKIKAKREEGR